MASSEWREQGALILALSLWERECLVRGALSQRETECLVRGALSQRERGLVAGGGSARRAVPGQFEIDPLGDAIQRVFRQLRPAADAVDGADQLVPEGLGCGGDRT